MHNGQWGNVCDDLFGIDDANVACWSLNYTDGAICYANSPFPSSSGIYSLYIRIISNIWLFVKGVMRNEMYAYCFLCGLLFFKTSDSV